MAEPIIQLRSVNEGELTEPATGATWTLTDYTDEGEHTGDPCAACEGPVYGTHYLCLDGGDCAHFGCVQVERGS